MTDQLLGVLFPAQHILLNEVHKSLGVRPMLELEVKTTTVILVPDVCALLSCSVFQNHLLQEQEGSLVINLLSNLDLRLPEMGRVCFLAFFTLEVAHDELNHESLLKQSSVEDLFLDCKLDLESSGMGLGPNETCIDHLHSLQSFDVLEAQTQKLGRLQLGFDPGRSEVPVALLAVLKLDSFRDSLRDINLRLEALDACVG